MFGVLCLLIAIPFGLPAGSSPLAYPTADIRYTIILSDHLAEYKTDYHFVLSVLATDGHSMSTSIPFGWGRHPTRECLINQ
jgi:hypothetical protein